MNLKTAHQITKLQGIKLKLEVKVLCPSCNRKTLILNLTDDKARCIRCDKEYRSVEEVRRIMEAEYLKKNKGLDMMMRTNSGQ